jgi:DNA-binding MarR family transcriptional regulator
MNVPQRKPLVRLIEEIRLAFNQMRTIADRTHEDLGVTASLRAVLETLQRNGPQTVPDMARMRNVSRQHIQKTVDAMTEQGLVEHRPNPAHKRSPIIRLSPHGSEVFAQIGHRERAILEALDTSLEEADIAAAVDTLKAFTQALDTSGAR